MVFDLKVSWLISKYRSQLAAALSDLVKVLDQATIDDEVRGIRDECQRMAEEVTKAIQMHGVVHRKDMDGDVYVYETDGYGSTYFMDDANIPSLLSWVRNMKKWCRASDNALLSLPYLGFVKADDPIYLRTRAMVLSDETNKYLLKGKAGWAIGGPHVGYGQGWPMSRSMQILTTTSREEQMDALRFLRSTTSGTGLIHESVDVDDPSHFVSSLYRYWSTSLLIIEHNSPAAGLPGQMWVAEDVHRLSLLIDLSNTGPLWRSHLTCAEDRPGSSKGTSILGYWEAWYLEEALYFNHWT